MVVLDLDDPVRRKQLIWASEYTIRVKHFGNVLLHLFQPGFFSLLQFLRYVECLPLQLLS